MGVPSRSGTVYGIRPTLVERGFTQWMNCVKARRLQRGTRGITGLVGGVGGPVTGFDQDPMSRLVRGRSAGGAAHGLEFPVRQRPPDPLGRAEPEPTEPEDAENQLEDPDAQDEQEEFGV